MTTTNKSFHCQSLRLALDGCLCLQHLCHNLLFLNQEGPYYPVINSTYYILNKYYYETSIAQHGMQAKPENEMRSNLELKMYIMVHLRILNSLVPKKIAKKYSKLCCSELKYLSFIYNTSV